MLGTFLLILPFAAAGALSPMMFSEQMVLMASPEGRRSATRYALGAFLTLLVFTIAMTLIGRAISLPSEPRLSASLDIALGIFLIAVATAVHYVRRRDPGSSSPKGRGKGRVRSIGAREAFGFGAFSMATNVTTLAVVLPAAKLIAASGIGYPGRLPLELLTAVIASAPAWLPVALTKLAPSPAHRVLDFIGALIANHGRDLIGAALAVLGLFLLIRGAVETLSL